MRSVIRIFLPALVLASCAVHGAWTPDFGAEYLGVKYVNDPLGEGVGYDADPLIRTDAFDCMTFVETSLACGNVDRLTQIRYADGTVLFTKRNHFFSADWVPNNSNLVENISKGFGATSHRNGTIDKANWFKTVHNINVNLAPVSASIEYVPYSNIEKIDVSEPVLVAFVVDNPAMRKKIGSDILVSHVGFLMPGGVLRHASSSAGRVIDTDFMEYIKLRATDSANLGVAFFKIRGTCK